MGVCGCVGNQHRPRNTARTLLGSCALQCVYVCVIHSNVLHPCLPHAESATKATPQGYHSQVPLSLLQLTDGAGVAAAIRLVVSPVCVDVVMVRPAAAAAATCSC